MCHSLFIWEQEWMQRDFLTEVLTLVQQITDLGMLVVLFTHNSITLKYNLELKSGQA